MLRGGEVEEEGIGREKRNGNSGDEDKRQQELETAADRRGTCTYTLRSESREKAVDRRTAPAGDKRQRSQSLP